ncbi:hypothetical protein [Gordonia sihwensis]|uniref:hypothetical protein n=1 Tax=Gordonia sihwensis TaxID=173559 RepID=UPI002417865D|nr:hypothetical protein [Gordonia sihwensis]WFN93454.1 hypothetical protein P5P27_02450 [Gordonia sihwensis]
MSTAPAPAVVRRPVDASIDYQRRLAAKARDARRDLEYLAAAWPYVGALRERGTPRRWVQHDQRRASRMLRVREIERRGLRGVARPTPADVSVLDVLSQIASVAEWIVREMTHVLPQYRPEIWLPARAASADPRPWLRLAIRLLPQADAATRSDDEPIVMWIEARLHPVITTAARLLGDARDGQELAGLCPWCGGRTSKGVGYPTMRIHYPAELDLTQPLDPDVSPIERLAAGQAEPLIVCHGLLCDPPRDACGLDWHGQPAWAMREWDWLAKRLHPVAGRADR